MPTTKYAEFLTDVIKDLIAYLQLDMGIPQNRDKCSSLMFGAYHNISSFEEKELCAWILNASSDLDIDPLYKGHPQRDEEIEGYKADVRKVIEYLKTYLPPENLQQVNTLTPE